MYRKTRNNCLPWYNCSLNNHHGAIKDNIREGYGCSPHKITENALLDYVRVYIEILMREPDFRDTIMTVIGRAEDESKALKNQSTFLEKRIEASRRKLLQTYDDKLDGIISQGLYLQKQREFNKLIANDDGEIEEHQARLKQLAEKNDAEEAYSRVIEQVKHEGVNNQTLDLLFKRIIVFDPGDIHEGHLNEYDLSEGECRYLRENGGLLFVQNFRYKAVVTVEGAALGVPFSVK